METFSLPPFTPYPLRHTGGKSMFFDPLRSKYVQITPEELVRQRLVHYFMEEKHVPRSLITIEKVFFYQSMTRRADIIIHDNNATPLLLAECKAPDVPIHRKASFTMASEQMARYNKVIRATYLVLSNGLVHYCYHVDHHTHTITSLKLAELGPYPFLFS